MRFCLALCSAIVLIASCAKVEERNSAPKVADAQTARPAAAPLQPAIPETVAGTTTAPDAVPSPAERRITGTVLETLDAGGYTFIRVKTAHEEQWAAVRATKIGRRQSVAIDGKMLMENFEAKSLGRKFDTIVFGTLAAAPAAVTRAAAMPASAQLPPGHPAPTEALAIAAKEHMQSAPAGDTHVERAEGGSTVAEIWAAKENGREVVVRGKVVKFLASIMGRNWIHLRDGSGSKAGGDDDLTITTAEVAAVGDVVVVRGRLAVDRDFGAGYRYPVIVEEAKLTK